ncbi:MarR family winged helix-turn-helix transcriptional regulator [Aestuariivita boseongensis]|uniref:MarR family winged helix-turn-helix transcriptional regulator n=1 Tax=Aestuariivita boseongensis TaxID=1470562 RepID=UPI000680AD5B|nr:MarR family transcriptional regulator [Aestuariivita boseongensis]
MPDDMSPLRKGAKQGSFVDNYLLYLLASVSHHASGQFHAYVRSKGVRVPEWRVLATLHDEDGAMITTLARISLLEQSHLTKIVDQMQRAGLVKRRPDPKDARRVRVFLTEKGRELATELVTDARAHEASLMDRLSEEEAAAIKPVLKSLLARLEP